MFSVHQHWDPLKVCAVGRSYPPEFYSYIKDSRVRNVFEKIAIETEEDYQKIISKLEEFNVQVVRTDISDDLEIYHRYDSDGNMRTAVRPPMCPRDHTAMMGNRFFMPGKDYGNSRRFVTNLLKNLSIVEIVDRLENDDSLQKYLFDLLLPGRPVNVATVAKLKRIIKEGFYRASFIDDDFIQIVEQAMTMTIGSNDSFPKFNRVNAFASIENLVKDAGNEIVYDKYINTATNTRIGKDLYFSYTNIINKLNEKRFNNNLKRLFPEHRVHPLDIAGHSDGAFCPVKPGLILTFVSPDYYRTTFPGWEVVPLYEQGWDKVKPHVDAKFKHSNRYWVPGEEKNDVFHDYITEWYDHWVGYVEETVFDVNMLVIDEKNVICNNENDQVFEAFERHGITPHVINFRHRYFWDGGLHCITSDLHREGTQQDYFPDRELGYDYSISA